MSRNFLYTMMTAAFGTLLALASRPGQAQTAFEGDAFASVEILTTPTSTFHYTISSGNVTIVPGSVVLTGDGSANGAGSVNTLNNNSSLPALTDTVQASSFAAGTTGTSAAKHGKSQIAVASNPAAVITLKNTGSSALSLKFVWSYDIYAQALSVRSGHDSASALSTAAFSFNDPQESLNILDAVGELNYGNAPNPVSLEDYNSLLYTVTVSAGSTDTLQLTVGSAGIAQSAPEPGVVATLIGLGCGVGGLLVRRRR